MIRKILFLTLLVAAAENDDDFKQRFLALEKAYKILETKVAAMDENNQVKYL